MDSLELRLLNEFQRDLPLCPAPYAAMGATLGVSEATVIDTLARLQRAGKVSRVGAVFRPGVIGASTLAAMMVPEDRLAEVAAIVNAHPQVNHNYARSHEWNLWFVATAPDAQTLAAVLQRIETECRCPLIRLPLIEDYHVDLGFALGGTQTPRPAARSASPVGPVTLTERQMALVAALEAGLAFAHNPYAELGARADMLETEVLATLRDWISTGVISRMGVIVRHLELGYTANAMTVWDVPDDIAGTIGRRLAAADYVTLCYRRARDLPHWRYNLYCMIHGRNHERVLAQVEWLRETCGLAGYPFAVLFSSQRFKQRGARYAPQPEPAHG
jgi:DNA-binding Lrp family transcriptional regulator